MSTAVPIAYLSPAWGLKICCNGLRYRSVKPWIFVLGRWDRDGFTCGLSLRVTFELNHGPPADANFLQRPKSDSAPSGCRVLCAFIYNFVVGALLIAAPRTMRGEPVRQMTGLLMFPIMLRRPRSIVQAIPNAWRLRGSDLYRCR